MMFPTLGRQRKTFGKAPVDRKKELYGWGTQSCMCVGAVAGGQCETICMATSWSGPPANSGNSGVRMHGLGVVGQHGRVRSAVKTTRIAMRWRHWKHVHRIDLPPEDF